MSQTMTKLIWKITWKAMAGYGNADWKNRHDPIHCKDVTFNLPSEHHSTAKWPEIAFPYEELPVKVILELSKVRG